MGCPQFVELRSIFKEANGKVKKVVATNVDLLHGSKLKLLNIYSRPVA
jgi:hypothetical protein